MLISLRILKNTLILYKNVVRIVSLQFVLLLYYSKVVMVANFKVYKKPSLNGKIILYLAKRDFVDHVSGVEAIDGVMYLDDEYMKNRKIFGQILCSFRYGRVEDEVMGLNFQKDLFLESCQLYPKPDSVDELTMFQARLMRKLGDNVVPFTLHLPLACPASVTLQQDDNDSGEPCGVQYFIKVFPGENETDQTHKKSTVQMAIRKIQYAPSKTGKHPCTVVRRDFMLSPGELELEVSLDKQLYHHGEKIAINVIVRNKSSKTVKKIKAMIQQGVDVILFQNGEYRNTISSLESQEGCPIQPGSSFQKTIYLSPSLDSNRNRKGIALDGKLKNEDTDLASTTLLSSPEQRDAFGILVSYLAKVKLMLGALNGELVAELPFVLMHPKPSKRKLLHADSQAEVETFRQDTIDQDPEND